MVIFLVREEPTHYMVWPKKKKKENKLVGSLKKKKRERYLKATVVSALVTMLFILGAPEIV